MLNILWVEDEYSEQKQRQWFKDRRVTVETSFDAAERVINSDLNKYDVFVLDINLENSEHSDNVKTHADNYEVSAQEFLKKSGMNLYFMLLENGFPKERIVFLTANANAYTSNINDLRQAFDHGDDETFLKLLTSLTSGFDDENKKNAYQFVSHPDGYDENDIAKLCNYLESYFNRLNKGEGKNTYETLLDTAKNCRVDVPKALNKGTNQLDLELKEFEANKYLILRRGVIEGCTFLKNHIKNNDANIQFRDFIKLENNQPSIEIPTTEIENYLYATAQSLVIRQPIDTSALNIQYRLFLRTLVHEWEENIDAKRLKEKYPQYFRKDQPNSFGRMNDIYTFAWIMKMTRNWVSHAKLLEPLDPQIIAFLFLANMRAMFKLPKAIQPYEHILLRCITSSPTNDFKQLNENICHVESDVNDILSVLSINESSHFGKNINEIYRRNTGNPDAEEHDFKRFLLQYFWVNQKANLRSLTANSDEFLPTLARHIYSLSFKKNH
ncbi:MAG: hypothetical protein PHY54_11395 [Methylococcales bacterium]|nr:hypothetical protein [Methylococcales bacterium]